ncbi:hypothetical protein MATL_G00251590 [Megalops atlanticus]|uniref:Uncharacterized protein n=1 Tax=Megalops atlanticus TaxID=7932 RepID=A0A9D3PAR9_MEGAT|nr:hypothetical protein MATL_G00251590 [Megalops atlanticus]
MSSCVTFQTELSTIMEILARTAVAEISKLVDESCAALRCEMSRRQTENEALKQKLQLMERELRTARGRASRERVFGQEWSFGVWRDAETTAVEEESTPLQSVMREESADMEENTPESLLIKEERLEDNLWSRDPQRLLRVKAAVHVCSTGAVQYGADAGERAVYEKQLSEEQYNTKLIPAPEEQLTQTPADDPKEQVTQTPAGDPEELGEKHRCGHSEEDLSGMEFVVKAEQEEEHVAQRLSQTGCEHSAGRLNNLDPEYVTCRALQASPDLRGRAESS